MRRIPVLIAVMFAIPCLCVAAPNLSAPPIAFTERVLPNGLRVIESLDKTTPNVTVQVWYGVGAKNDPTGRSGFAHLFEHLMFKATRDLPPEAFDRLTEDVGGMNNAFTEDDATAFYEVIPANHLQRLIWAEAERMSGLVVDAANFHSERLVVEEELRERVLAQPYGRLFNLDIPKDTFVVHPYRRAPIGAIADLDAADLDDVRAFHAAFYRPDDATLVVVGNFDPADLDAWIDRYFAPIPRPAASIPQVSTSEPARTGPKSFTEYGPNVPLPAVVITWLAPPAIDADGPALQVLDAVLSAGKSSRLYDHLVYQKEIAGQVFSSADLRAQLGLFEVGAILASGKRVAEGEQALRSEVADLRAREVSPGELQVAKNQLLAGAVRERETVDGRGTEIGRAIVEEGDPNRANSDLVALQAVTAADVQRVARKYLADDSRAVIRYLPESERPAGAPPPPPEAPAVSTAPYGGPVAILLPEAERQKPPPVGAPVAAQLPVAAERTLANGLRVIVARSSDQPIVAAELLAIGGAQTDPPHLAGAASLAAALLTEGTTTRSAPQIAQQVEALGAELSSGSGWEAEQVSLSVLTSQAPAALAIMADVAEHPAFAPAELERLRKQSLDEFSEAMQQPGRIAGFLTREVVFAGTPFGHVDGGDPASLARLTRADLAAEHDRTWRPDNAVLVLTGDIADDDGFALAQQAFGGWSSPSGPLPAPSAIGVPPPPRDVAVDLPGTGQAAVVVAGPAVARADRRFYLGIVADAVLGGGYSARLNEEIRIKRGLSYGAGSELDAATGLFVASSQTRNDAASRVADLLMQEIASLAADPPGGDELAARKSSLIGQYGRTLATADGLAGEIADLALHDVGTAEIGRYPGKVEAVTSADVAAFAREVLRPSAMSLIVVGDAKAFAPALKTAFPGLVLIPATGLDLDSPNLGAR